jgi:DNA polymerase
MDMETYSELSIKDVGAEVYARHESTDIICMAYSVNGNEPILWAPWLPVPPVFAVWIALSYVFEAHNAAFERAIWRHIAVPRYGFPPIPEGAWRCSMAACAHKAVALKLSSGARMLRVDQQKDTAGAAAMRYLSSPGPIGRRYDIARYETCAAYCMQDVRTEVAISRKVGSLPVDELRLWQLDQRINQRGVWIDTELCEAAVAIAEQVTTPLFEEFNKITGLKPTQRDKVIEWLNENDANWTFVSLTADAVDEAMAMAQLSDRVYRALEIRQQIAKASVKKYSAALAVTGSDGRARGLLQYHGAGTGRWAGRMIQPQNMPRPSNEHLDMGDLVALIKTRDLEAIRMILGDPMLALADAARGMVIPSPGNVLAVYDFSSIEAIVLAGMAGDRKKLEAFRRKECAYCAAAEVIYGYPVNKKDHPAERQDGKTCELAFQYNGGVGAWRNFDSSDRHTDEEVEGFRDAWRADRPLVVAMWKGLNYAAKSCVRTGEPQEYAGFLYEREGDWMSCRLLSGRKIWYLHPRITEGEMPWTDDDGEPVFRPGVEYSAYKEGRIKEVRGYGGHWTENNDQALARDIMVSSMRRVDPEFPLVLTSHDELISEIPEGQADRARQMIPTLMAQTDDWFADWPIRAEGKILRRYEK